MENKGMNGNGKHRNFPRRNCNRLPLNLNCLETDDDNGPTNKCSLQDKKKVSLVTNDIINLALIGGRVRETKLHTALKDMKPKSNVSEQQKKRSDVMAALMKELLCSPNTSPRPFDTRKERPRNTLYTVPEDAETTAESLSQSSTPSPVRKFDHAVNKPPRRKKMQNPQRTSSVDSESWNTLLDNKGHILEDNDNICVSLPSCSLRLLNSDDKTRSPSPESETKQIDTRRSNSDSKSSSSFFTSMEDIFSSQSSPTFPSSPEKEMLSTYSTQEHEKAQRYTDHKFRLARTRRRALHDRDSMPTVVTPHSSTEKVSGGSSLEMTNSQLESTLSSLLDMQLADSNLLGNEVEIGNFKTRSLLQEVQDMLDLGDHSLVNTPRSDASERSSNSVEQANSKLLLSDSQCKEDNLTSEQQLEQMMSQLHARKLFKLPPLRLSCRNKGSNKQEVEMYNPPNVNEEFKLVFPPEMIHTPRDSRETETVCTGEISARNSARQDHQPENDLTRHSTSTQSVDSEPCSPSSDLCKTSFKLPESGMQSEELSDQSNKLEEQAYSDHDGQCFRPSEFFNVFLAKSRSKLHENKNTISGDDEILNFNTCYNTEIKTLQSSELRDIESKPIGDTKSEENISLTSATHSVKEDSQVCSPKSDLGECKAIDLDTRTKAEKIILSNKWFTEELEHKKNKMNRQVRKQKPELVALCNPYVKLPKQVTCNRNVYAESNCTKKLSQNTDEGNSETINLPKQRRNTQLCSPEEEIMRVGEVRQQNRLCQSEKINNVDEKHTSIQKRKVKSDTFSIPQTFNAQKSDIVIEDCESTDVRQTEHTGIDMNKAEIADATKGVTYLKTQPLSSRYYSDESIAYSLSLASVGEPQGCTCARRFCEIILSFFFSPRK